MSSGVSLHRLAGGLQVTGGCGGCSRRGRKRKMEACAVPHLEPAGIAGTSGSKTSKFSLFKWNVKHRGENPPFPPLIGDTCNFWGRRGAFSSALPEKQRWWSAAILQNGRNEDVSNAIWNCTPSHVLSFSLFKSCSFYEVSSSRFPSYRSLRGMCNAERHLSFLIHQIRVDRPSYSLTPFSVLSINEAVHLQVAFSLYKSKLSNSDEFPWFVSLQLADC